MSTATTTTPAKNESPDAVRMPSAEVVAPEPKVLPSEPLDVELADPYDNIACTD